MLNFISPNYYWPIMIQDITQFAKHCEICQNKKPGQKRFGLLQAMPPTDQRSECLSIHTVGGFNSYNSLLSMKPLKLPKHVLMNFI